MAMASSDFGGSPAEGGVLHWLAKSWMAIAFFVGFFAVWEGSVHLFHVPLYILAPPSLIVTNASADLPRLLNYTAVTGLETIGHCIQSDLTHFRCRMS